jgi:hypothetical protein
VDLKLNTRKITLEGTFSRSGVNNKVIGITGAGDSAYLWAIKRRVLDEFRKCRDIQSFESTLGSEIASFYKRHIIPFNPQQWGDTRIELIVAAKIDGISRMWSTSRNTVTRCDSLALTGCGESWVRYFTWGSNIRGSTTKVATILAAYAVFVAKEMAEGCGKNTTILGIPLDSKPLCVADDGAVRKMEELFSRHQEDQRRNFWQSFGAGFDGEPPGISNTEIGQALLSIDPYHSDFKPSVPRTSEDPQ